jgi:hypothetical protein
MHYNVEVFVQQFPIVKRFVYHLTYYRELLNLHRTLQLKSEFWTCTIDAHLLQAAILWCMIFGAHGCNPVHWKKLSEGESKELEESFRQGLLAQTGMTEAKWKNYWDDMTDFRNKYAAHRELDYEEPVPEFDSALKVAYYYDRWIREVISPDIFEEPPLERFAEALKQSVTPLICQLFECTRQYNAAEHLTPIRPPLSRGRRVRVTGAGRPPRGDR